MGVRRRCTQNQMNIAFGRFLQTSSRNPSCQRSIQQSLSSSPFKPSTPVFSRHQEIFLRRCQRLRFHFVSFHTSSSLKMSDEVEKAKQQLEGKRSRGLCSKRL